MIYFTDLESQFVTLNVQSVEFFIILQVSSCSIQGFYPPSFNFFYFSILFRIKVHLICS